jgi:hypothetical protein
VITTFWWTSSISVASTALRRMKSLKLVRDCAVAASRSARSRAERRTLTGEPVAISETEDGTMAVHYFDVLLGHIHKGARSIRRLRLKVLPMSPV